MKTFIHIKKQIIKTGIFCILLLVQFAVFSQNKLPDGIYLVDQLGTQRGIMQKNTAAIQFNPLFVNEDSGEYDPILIFTNEFVPLELKSEPVIQLQKNNEHLLLVSLTDEAQQHLTSFTGKNIKKQVVVVVDGQALAVYKLMGPVVSKEIRIAKCFGSGCRQVTRYLKNELRNR